MSVGRRVLAAGLAGFVALAGAGRTATNKPVLHGKHWLAITGKPLAATAGAMTFQKGGNAVDAACAMLAATTTMFDTLSWGGETQALIFNPRTGKVVAVNALGVAPTGATPAFFRARGMAYPPEYGPLAAVTPGTPGGLMLMLAEYGKLSLAEVLAPALEMAEGYPIEGQLADGIEREKARIAEWPYSKKLFLTHPGEAREAPRAGEVFRQPDLHATLSKLRRGRGGRARRRPHPPRRDPRGLRPLLSRRHRRGVRARRAGAGGTRSPSRTSRGGRRGSRNRSGPPTAESTSTSSTCGRRDRPCSRP